MSQISLREKQIHFQSEVIRILDSQKHILSDAEYQEVMHLIQHNENGEALRTLAFILVEERKPASESIFKEIGNLAFGLISREDMPDIVGRYLNEA